MTMNNAEIVPGGRLHLLGLPKELQTIIFDLAYQPVPDTRLVTADKWRRDQSFEKQRATLPQDISMRDFPGSKASDFLMSKEYFVAAITSYARSQIFDADNHERQLRTGFLVPLVGEVVGNFIIASSCNFTSLRSLRLRISLYVFVVERVDDVELPVLRRLLTTEDYARFPMRTMLDHLRGVKYFELRPDELKGYDLSDEQRMYWRANVKLLEDIIRPKVIAPRVNASAKECGGKKGVRAREPLYAGSEVCWESSDAQVAQRPTVQTLQLGSGVLQLKSVAGVCRPRTKWSAPEVLQQPVEPAHEDHEGAADMVASRKPLTRKPEPTCHSGVPVKTVTKSSKTSEPDVDSATAVATIVNDRGPGGDWGVWLSKEQWQGLQTTSMADEEAVQSTKQRVKLAHDQAARLMKIMDKRERERQKLRAEQEAREEQDPGEGSMEGKAGLLAKEESLLSTTGMDVAYGIKIGHQAEASNSNDLDNHGADGPGSASRSPSEFEVLRTSKNASRKSATTQELERIVASMMAAAFCLWCLFCLYL